MKIFQKGFNYSQDGPGNRLVYHLQGCNMNCPWCSNPEGISLDGKCENITPEAMAAEILSAKPMFFDGGGVTFTGGEATLQADEIKEVLGRIKGIHTVIETNGNNASLSELLPLIDLVIFDLKHYDDSAYKQIGGCGKLIKENLKMLFESGRQCIIRTPLINGFNASKGDAGGFLAIIGRTALSVPLFEFLPYHEYGRDKWKKIGLQYQINDAFVSNEQVDLFKKLYGINGLKVINT